MSDIHSEDGRILYPWTMQDCEDLWNKWFSKKFGWRSFTLGKSGSASKAFYRLSMIIRKNARFLDCSVDSDISDAYEQWRTYMLGASAYIEKQGVERINHDLDRQYDVKLTFWRFLEPELRHLHEMTCLAMGVDPDGRLKADQDRRKAKAELLREFSSEVKQFAKQAAYLSGSDRHSNMRLEQALEIARTALSQASEDLQWMER